MRYEIRRYYCTGKGTIAHLDEESSVPAREISDEQAIAFMGLCEMMGMKRHETASQIFYDCYTDCTHITEEIFYK